MKKLIMAAAIVCAAAISQASTVNWQYSGAKLNDGTGKSTKYCTATSPAYLVFVSDLTRADALKGLNEAGSAKDYQATLADSAISSTAMKSSKIPSTAASDVTVAGDEKAYFVVFDGDKMFVSTEVTYTSYDELSGTYSWTFSTTDNKAGGQTTQEAIKLATANGGASWYTASVPEPTSGLLLLLGMAGLALRRRRA